MAIGGGSFQKNETRELDEFLIHKTEKQRPQVLFLATASRDDQGYAKRFKQYYRSLGCEVEALRLLHTKLAYEEIRVKLLSCDILYIGGGNLTFLIETLEAMQLTEVLREAFTKGILCVGYSAGASLFYTYGYSDLYDDGTSYGYVKGLDLIHGIFCPHAQDSQRQGFVQDAQFSGIMHYACKDGEAYLCEDGNVRPFDKKTKIQ